MDIFTDTKVKSFYTGIGIFEISILIGQMKCQSRKYIYDGKSYSKGRICEYFATSDVARFSRFQKYRIVNKYFLW